jgi:hypothetical protein
VETGLHPVLAYGATLAPYFLEGIMETLNDIWSQFALRQGIHLTQTLVNEIAAELKRSGEKGYTVENISAAYQKLKRQQHQRLAPEMQQSQQPEPQYDEKTDPRFPKQIVGESVLDFERRKYSYRENRARVAFQMREQQRLNNEPLNPDVRRRTLADLAARKRRTGETWKG